MRVSKTYVSELLIKGWLSNTTLLEGFGLFSGLGLFPEAINQVVIVVERIRFNVESELLVLGLNLKRRIVLLILLETDDL